jgi:hypothetical protein
MPAFPKTEPRKHTLDGLPHTEECVSQRRWGPRPVAPRDRPQAQARFAHAENALSRLIESPGLDAMSGRECTAMRSVDASVAEAIAAAYRSSSDGEDAHRFLQRVLYRINRLMLFWFDDLRRYENDRSPYLHRLRATIESAWQQWELAGISLPVMSAPEVVAALQARAAADVDAPPSDGGRYFRDGATLGAYRRLLEIVSLDGLVEASQLSRTLGGVGDPIHGTMTRLLLEEYGGGRLARKHSTYFRTMLECLGMDPTPEANFEVVPWEVLAGINHSFLLSDRRRLYLRYVGGLLYTETSVPAAFRCYLAAAERLGLPPDAMTYWTLHIKEDARHGPWMLDEVALPLAERYPDDAWELVLGYDQQRAMSARAGEASHRACAAAA